MFFHEETHHGQPCRCRIAPLCCSRTLLFRKTKTPDLHQSIQRQLDQYIAEPKWWRAGGGGDEHARSTSEYHSTKKIINKSTIYLQANIAAPFQCCFRDQLSKCPMTSQLQRVHQLCDNYTCPLYLCMDNFEQKLSRIDGGSRMQGGGSRRSILDRSECRSR